MAAQNPPWSLMDPEDSKKLISEIFYCNFDEEITKGQCCQLCLILELQFLGTYFGNVGNVTSKLVNFHDF